MALCADPNCGCGIIGGDGVYITGSGTAGDPWVINVTEPVDIADLEGDIADLQASLLTLPGTYVNTAGDTMTGRLTVSCTGQQISLIRTDSDSAHIGFYDATGNTRQGYIQHVSGSGFIINDQVDGYIRLAVVGLEQARLTNTQLLLGKTATNSNTVGIELSHNVGTIISTRSDSSTTYVGNKVGPTGDTASGSLFATWQINGSTIGSISRNTTTNAVLYNLTSDQDLKENFETIDDDQALLWMRLVQPSFYTYKGHPTELQVGYPAQDTLAMWPNAEQHGVITPGHGDVNDRTFDDDGHETTPADVWEPWQMDTSRIGPFVHAALQAVDRIVETQAATITTLQTQVADLTARLDALEAKPK